MNEKIRKPEDLLKLIENKIDPKDPLPYFDIKRPYPVETFYFFRRAALLRTGLSVQLLRREIAQGYSSANRLEIYELKHYISMPDLMERLNGWGIVPAVFSQTLLLSLVPGFWMFEPVFALASQAKNGYVPALDIKETLADVLKKEWRKTPDDDSASLFGPANSIRQAVREYRKRIELARAHRKLTGDFLNEYNSKGRRFAAVVAA